MIDKYSTASFSTQFTHQLSKYISSKLHERSIESLTCHLCSIRCTSALMSVVKFCVCTSERTLLIANFLLAAENLTKFPLLFKRIITQNVLNFLSNFRTIFLWKFDKTKKEIRPFHLYYFCTVLYACEFGDFICIYWPFFHVTFQFL